jgi:hypothetical protein
MIISADLSVAQGLPKTGCTELKLGKKKYTVVQRPFLLPRESLYFDQ